VSVKVPKTVPIISRHFQVPAINAAAENNLVMASIASANRNFEGRISPHTRANYLASPPLVVAFALAGRVDIDLTNEPLGYDRQGAPVYLSEIYPSADEIQALYAAVTPQLFRESYADLFTGDERWQSLTGGDNVLYQWDERSTYIAEPPYFALPNHRQTEDSLQGARVLLTLGDSITTDHISPAGVIPADSDAGRWLTEHGVRRADFNSYGSRRGNDAVMVRGTFVNVRLKNALAGGKEGGYTRCLPDGDLCTVFSAAQHYRATGVPLIVLAGKEYGTGSSRDWAAKGPLLLGVRAILAQSFERIHRANLVGMGVLPLQFLAGESAPNLGLSGEEAYDIAGLDRLVPGGQVSVTARARDGGATHFRMIARIDTPAELHTYRQGGILPEALGFNGAV
jgi:aconitate hydratase